MSSTQTRQAEMTIGLLNSNDKNNGRFRLVIQIGARRAGTTMSAYIDAADLARCMAGQAAYIALTVEDNSNGVNSL